MVRTSDRTAEKAAKELRSIRLLMLVPIGFSLLAASGPARADDALIRMLLLLKINVALIEKCSYAEGTRYHQQLLEAVPLAETYATSADAAGTTATVERMALDCSEDSIHVQRLMRGWAANRSGNDPDISGSFDSFGLGHLGEMLQADQSILAGSNFTCKETHSFGAVARAMSDTWIAGGTNRTMAGTTQSIRTHGTSEVRTLE